MKRLTAITLALTVLLMIAGSGCSAVTDKAAEVTAEKALEKATGAQVDINEQGKEVTVNDNKGNSVTLGETTKLPDNFPKDFPVYDGAKPQSSMTNNQKGQTGMFVNFTASGTPNEILEFYKNALPKSGYTISQTFSMGEAATLGLQKGGKDVGTLVITKGDENGQALISVTLQQ